MSGDIVIIGGGGHAKVVIDILRATGFHPVAVVDRAPAAATLLGVPIVGDDRQLEGLFRSGVCLAFCALGDNALRARLAHQASAIGFQFASAVSPAASLSPSAVLGAGVAVMPGAVVNADARIGDHAIINTLAGIDHDCQIGAFAHIGPGCALAGNVVIGRGVFLGLGTNVITGRRIGDNSQTGAGATVVDDLPADVLALGVPARVHRPLTRDGVRP